MKVRIRNEVGVGVGVGVRIRIRVRVAGRLCTTEAIGKERQMYYWGKGGGVVRGEGSCEDGGSGGVYQAQLGHCNPHHSHLPIAIRIIHAPDCAC